MCLSKLLILIEVLCKRCVCGKPPKIIIKQHKTLANFLSEGLGIEVLCGRCECFEGVGVGFSPEVRVSKNIAFAYQNKKKQNQKSAKQHRCMILDPPGDFTHWAISPTG